MAYDKSGIKISIDQLTDEQNALLNSVAYADLQSGWGAKDNVTDQQKTLFDVVYEADKGLAKELKAAGLGDLVIKDYVNKNGNNGSGFCAIAFEGNMGTVHTFLR